MRFAGYNCIYSTNIHQEPDCPGLSRSTEDLLFRVGIAPACFPFGHSMLSVPVKGRGEKKDWQGGSVTVSRTERQAQQNPRIAGRQALNAFVLTVALTRNKD